MSHDSHKPTPLPDTDAYYRLLCDTLGVALIATDLDLNICVWNAAAARTFGAGAKAMMSSPLIFIIPQPERDKAGKVFRQSADTGETIQFEFHHRDDLGEARELAATVAPVVTEDGERVGISVCIRDITERIALQGKLADSGKMIALGEMAGAVAHHFNNILGGVVTSIDFIRTSYDPVMTQRVLGEVQNALQRATSLVDGLLAFAEGNRRADDLSDFTEILIEVGRETERLLEGRDIEFELNLADLPVMAFPRTQVVTMFRNLVQNAVEAMPTGGVLKIGAEMAANHVTVTVKDSGCGIDATVMARIFEPFWTTKGVLSSEIGSGSAAGLGLAITHGLITMLDGSVTVSSEPGVGSTFAVTLPIPQSQ